jgi:hypothetical protein
MPSSLHGSAPIGDPCVFVNTAPRLPKGGQSSDKMLPVHDIRQHVGVREVIGDTGEVIGRIGHRMRHLDWVCVYQARKARRHDRIGVG